MLAVTAAVHCRSASDGFLASPRSADSAVRGLALTIDAITASIVRSAPRQCSRHRAHLGLWPRTHSGHGQAGRRPGSPPFDAYAHPPLGAILPLHPGPGEEDAGQQGQRKPQRPTRSSPTPPPTSVCLFKGSSAVADKFSPNFRSHAGAGHGASCSSTCCRGRMGNVTSA